MNRHRPFLELAATAIDYPLETSERRHLDEHLAGCRECARAMAALGADAGAIGSLPPVRLAERRGDQILAAALRPAAAGHPLRLVAIAALLALLITGSIAVGAVLLQRMDEDLSVVLPLPTATASRDPEPSPSPLASPSASAGLVAVQPWGRFVVTSEDQQRSWVDVAMPDGSRTRLAEGAGAAWLGADRVVFECTQPGPDFLGICSINADASGPVQPITADANHPAPAPDGRSIAFHRAGIDLGETWIVRADGSGERRVAPGFLLEWSPDGAWLAGQPDGAAVQVAIIRADGTGLRRLAPGRDPAWSPAGDRLVYVFNDDQGGASLRTVDVATGEVTVQFAAAAGSELGEPAWLGNRGWVFVLDGDVWRLDVGASEPVRLTTDLAIEFGGLAGDPLAVSVDNQWIAFTTGIDADSRVGIVSANGDLDTMYPGTAGMSDPHWAPGPVVEAPTPSPSAPAPTPSAPTASAKSPGGDLPVGWAWTASTVQTVAGRPDGLVEAVTAGGPGFVAVGRGCTTDADPACEGVVWTSTDGRAWVRAAASDATDTGASFPASGPELGMYDVAAGTPGIVAVGYAARPDMQATIWFSPDASSWERIPLGPDGPGTAPDDPMDIRIEAVTWDGQRFVAVGADRSDFNGRNLGTAQAQAAVWTSTDGRSWARVRHTADLDVGGFLDTGEDPTTGGMRDVVAGPGGLVAVGANCDETAGGCWPAAWSSVDGTMWAQQPTDIPKIEAGDLREVAASDAAYIAVGPAWCDACQDLVFTSTDGRTWERQTFDGHSDFGAVASIGGMLFAIGPIGSTTVWTSDDGEVWLASGLDGGPTTGRGTAQWHFAATPDTAVWLGSTAASELPEAWVSEGQTAP